MSCVPANSEGVFVSYRRMPLAMLTKNFGLTTQSKFAEYRSLTLFDPMRSQRSLNFSGSNTDPFGCSAGAPPRFRLRVLPPATLSRMLRLSCDETFQFTKSDESVQLNVLPVKGAGELRKMADRSMRLSLRLKPA